MSQKTKSIRISARASAAMKAQAADWFSRKDRGLSAPESADYQAWLAADPRHVEAMRQVERATHELALFRGNQHTAKLVGKIEAKVSAIQRGRRLTRLAIGAAAAVMIAGAAQFSWREAQPAAPVATGTITVKPERRFFSDGSWADLNATGELIEDFSATQRAVKVVRGKAYFSVVKDPSRPFVVTAGAITVKALGTEFSVALNPADISVLVTSGKVAVDRMATDATTGEVDSTRLVLGAGDQVHVPHDPTAGPLKVEDTQPEEIKSAQAWRTQRVRFSDVPLKEIIEAYNRQNQLQLAVRGEAAAALQVSCTHWLDDPEGFARIMASSAGFRIIRESSTRVVLLQP